METIAADLASIQTLSSQVVDQIAAGEVVERPAHLVKELVENSLDAGATEVAIEFREGGRWVKITDNGRGIPGKDLAKALERFATSKIRASEDLWNLTTFGFRGEALASISSVSRLSLVSRQATSSLAFQLQSEFGKLKPVEQVGGSFGTSVLIEDLFANVPARLKFMKSPSAEVTQIKTVLKAMALSHFKTSFRVISDGNLLFQWPATADRLSRARQILGVARLFEGSGQRENVKVYSVFADPHTTAKTSKSIWLFAQGRWIQDRGLQAAVQEAYRNLLMHGEYPICVSWVETDPSAIDVNIHPTKSQVKFLDQSLAFRAVQASVRDSLEKAPWIENAPGIVNAPGLKSAVASAVDSFARSGRGFGMEAVPPQNLVFQDVALEKIQFASKPSFSAKSSSENKQDSKPYWSSFQVLGQANLTYILTQSANSMLIVDQHAAHERVLFEKLQKAWKNGQIEVQEYLFPLAIDLSADKTEALLTEEKNLQKIGLHLESLGPTTVGIRAAPLLLKEKSIVLALDKMAADLVEFGGSHGAERMIGDVCATLACHSAVRAGQSLSTDEMKALLQSMDEFPLSSFCPHGRPVSVDYSFFELEKDFGRLV